MKLLYKVVLLLYLLILLWLVLFKFSYDIISVLSDYQMRSLNLIPFIDSSRSETISNFIVFIPFGLLLSVNFKQINFWRKLAVVFFLSLSAEIVQYIFAIGTTDITDVIMNTLGGFVGLLLYALANKYINAKKIDAFIAISGIALMVVFMSLRLFVFKVRY